MSKINLLIVLISAALLLAACSSAVTAPEEATKPGPGESVNNNEPVSPTIPVEQGAVYMEHLEVLPGKTADELVLHLSGNLPTPCSQLTLTASLAEGTNKIEVVAYSSEPADKMCAQMLSAFDEQVSVPGLKEGSYDIYFNGEPVRTLSVPLPAK